MQLFLKSPAEADALKACVNNYLDNEGDKGMEGIGVDLTDHVAEVLKQIEDGSACISLDLMQRALVWKALEMHSDGDAEETFDLAGADEAIASMLAQVSEAEREEVKAGDPSVFAHVSGLWVDHLDAEIQELDAASPVGERIVSYLKLVEQVLSFTDEEKEWQEIAIAAARQAQIWYFG